MSIRSKLAWTFIILLIFGITAISSYSILFIRNFLLKEGVEEIKRDARWMAKTVQNIPESRRFQTQVQTVRNTAEYHLALYDANGKLLHSFPSDDYTRISKKIPPQIREKIAEDTTYVVNHTDSTHLIAWSAMPGSLNQAKYLQINQNKDQFYKPIKTIRWIIYSGMFISIALVILVSILFARYISRPIMQLKDAALQIAEGDVKREIHLNRNDEFGTLADSLNAMAFKLRADNEELKDINRRQRQFFADITHEIKNPLHTIAGSLEMLQIDELPEEKRMKYIRNAQKQTERINRLYKDLLTLQRYESDNYFIETKPFDLKSIVQHLQDIFYDKARQKGLTLDMDLHTCSVRADPDKIEQVLENLLSNAIKYTSDGFIKLRYSRKGKWVYIKVQDTGCGIAKEHLDRLFDRFYRTDKARSRDKGGTGLGLSVVKSILKAHNEDIHVESKPEKGTTFWFKLPAANASSV